MKGWDIVYSNEGKKRYEFAKRNRTKIISVILNKNKAKSSILSKIAERDLPNCFSVISKGLSISFKKFGNVALLDSVGFESPLFESDGEEYWLKSEKKKKKEHFIKIWIIWKNKLKILKKIEMLIKLRIWKWIFSFEK